MGEPFPGRKAHKFISVIFKVFLFRKDNHCRVSPLLRSYHHLSTPLYPFPTAVMPPPPPLPWLALECSGELRAYPPRQKQI